MSDVRSISGLIDANDETVVFGVQPGEQATFNLAYTTDGTYSLTRSFAGSTSVEVDSYTASAAVTVQDPGSYTITGSSITSGSAQIDGLIYRLTST